MCLGAVVEHLPIAGEKTPFDRVAVVDHAMDRGHAPVKRAVLEGDLAVVCAAVRILTDEDKPLPRPPEEEDTSSRR